VGSQFYITFARAPSLDGAFPVIGRLLGSQDVPWRRWEALPTGRQAPPRARRARPQRAHVRADPLQMPRQGQDRLLNPQAQRVPFHRSRRI
jgi:cyclophilin family peptidyl-prolyl cis-trans isomerase